MRSWHCRVCHGVAGWQRKCERAEVQTDCREGRRGIPGGGGAAGCVRRQGKGRHVNGVWEGKVKRSRRSWRCRVCRGRVGSRSVGQRQGGVGEKGPFPGTAKVLAMVEQLEGVCVVGLEVQG